MVHCIESYKKNSKKKKKKIINENLGVRGARGIKKRKKIEHSKLLYGLWFYGSLFLQQNTCFPILKVEASFLILFFSCRLKKADGLFSDYEKLLVYIYPLYLLSTSTQKISNSSELVYLHNSSENMMIIFI